MSPRLSRLSRHFALIACIAAFILAIVADIPIVATIIALAGVALILSNFESDLREFTNELKDANVDFANIDSKAVIELRRDNPGMSIADAIKVIEAEKGSD